MKRAESLGQPKYIQNNNALTRLLKKLWKQEFRETFLASIQEEKCIQIQTPPENKGRLVENVYLLRYIQE